jgi:hypothetical protein
MFSPLRLRVVVSCLLALTLLTIVSHAQNVTTWHDDNNRTGWQQNESFLTPSNVSLLNSFGLLWQWTVTGQVFAQPLAVANVANSNCSPCNLVFISTEQDMVYAFNPAPSAQSNPQVWSVDLAGNVGGTAVDCTNLPVGISFGPCNSPSLSNSFVGTTGTPVIDLTATPHPILYVVGAVYFGNTFPDIEYYLFAVDITSGAVLAKTQISGSVHGQAPPQNEGQICTSTFPASGQVNFNPAVQIERAALLLLNGIVYVAFAPYPEFNNGWLFGYTYSNNSFSAPIIFNSTPYGTGGGIWQSGGGPASDGNYIYVLTGNGTLQAQEDTPLELGDSLIKLSPPLLLVADYFTPSDVLTLSQKPRWGAASTTKTLRPEESCSLPDLLTTP